SDSLHDVMIYQEPTRTRKEAFIKAEKGHLTSEQGGQTITLYLQDGSVLRYLQHRKDGEIIPVVEATQFDRYRISFDLSELAFSRSDPSDRSRNDRTMDVQAMMAIVDSLQAEISNQKQQVVDNQNYILPGSSENASRIHHIDRPEWDSLTTPPYQSEFIALNKLESTSAQRELNQTAISELRNYKAVFEDVIIDTSWRISKVARYLVEIHKKFSIPVACIIFVLLGAPIGMYTRKGNLGYAALIGTVFLTFYWISIIQGEKLADRLYISPFMGMWFSNILLALIGSYMIIKICTGFSLWDAFTKILPAKSD
ncbi:MAG TPA: LptF/LptG family permease, partial [Balneolaceae bacterium]|nr:LptF/LptG family permease [Balneolaceae bacterium]